LVVNGIDLPANAEGIHEPREQDEVHRDGPVLGCRPHPETEQHKRNVVLCAEEEVGKGNHCNQEEQLIQREIHLLSAVIVILLTINKIVSIANSSLLDRVVGFKDSFGFVGGWL
jgi:hypothetical protein